VIARTAVESDDAIRDELARAVGPATILLAGSRAAGDVSAESDYDLVVVLPAARIARAMPHLRRAQAALEARLGAPVSVNPVPPIVLRHPERNLFVWKMLREPRVLAAAGRVPRAPPGGPPVGAEISFSYLLSAVFYLLDPLEPAMLAGERLPRAVSAGVRKALLHVAQLRLFQTGRSVSRLAEAVAQAGDPALARLERQLDRPSGWLACRRVVLGELGERPPKLSLMRATARNAQYAILAASRGGPRWRAAAGLRAIDRPLAVVAVRLLRAVMDGGDVDPAATAAARRALPAALRAAAPRTWHGLRDLVGAEWSNAHPVLGL
jgi:predicted nucleotidyltransferase